MRSVHAFAAILLLVACQGGESRGSAGASPAPDSGTAARTASSDWLLAPDATDDAVHASDTEAALRARYGADNVTPARFEMGEGETSPGTTIFPRDPRRRLAVAWGDTIARARPVRVRVDGDSTRWRVVPGVSIGTRLSELERLNGRPFNLLGFQFDYAGTVDSWQGGRLDSLWRPAPGKRHLVWLRLRPDDAADGALESSVMGDRVFSSAHPAMRALDPRVYDLFVEPR
jgi:hypothetical protein